MSRYKKYKESYQKYYQLHRDEILTKKRERPECKERYKEYNTRYRKTHPTELRKHNLNWRRNNREKKRVHTLIYRHPEKYPLVDECVFCGVADNLEHGHLDYEEDGYNYLTVCHQCNLWMDRGVD